LSYFSISFLQEKTDVVKKDLTPFEAAEAELRALVELKRKQVSFGILLFFISDNLKKTLNKFWNSRAVIKLRTYFFAFVSSSERNL
jgi:hypothetical protein